MHPPQFPSPYLPHFLTRFVRLVKFIGMGLQWCGQIILQQKKLKQLASLHFCPVPKITSTSISSMLVIIMLVLPIEDILAVDNLLLWLSCYNLVRLPFVTYNNHDWMKYPNMYQVLQYLFNTQGFTKRAYISISQCQLFIYLLCYYYYYY